MTDEQWLSDLFHQNYTLLYRVGLVFLADGDAGGMIEEQIQETFLLAWQKRQKLRQHPNPSGWLVETFRHCLQHSCRKQIREFRHRSFDMDASDRADIQDTVHGTAEQLIEAKEQTEQLYKLLGKRDADIFIRFCLRHDKAEDIGKAYGISGAAVRMCVSRVRQKIIANRALFLCLAVIAAACLKGGRGS